MLRIVRTAAGSIELFHMVVGGMSGIPSTKWLEGVGPANQQATVGSRSYARVVLAFVSRFAFELA